MAAATSKLRKFHSFAIITGAKLCKLVSTLAETQRTNDDLQERERERMCPPS